MESYKYEKHPWWEDAKQDAYLLMLEKDYQFPDLEQEERWIYVTAKNFLNNIIRKNSNYPCFSSLSKNSEDYYNPEPQLFKQNLYCVISESITNAQLLRVLTDQERLIFRLHYHGYSYDEIGDIFEINSLYARKKIERIRMKVKSYYPIFVREYA